MPASYSSTRFSPAALFAGDRDITSRQVTLISGQNLTRGAVLGKITASGKYTLSTAAAVDGSQTPDLILAEDTDATGGDKLTPAYVTGGFDDARITLGAGHTVASVWDGLRAKGIILISVQTTY